MRSDIQDGSVFPDFELSDQSGQKCKLSVLQGADPMLLVLGRGGYCPKEIRFHMNLVDFHPELVVGYTQLVTITTDDLIKTNEFRQGVGARWPFLSDPKRVVQKDLDIQEYTDPKNDPMIPHVFVLEPGLKIFKIYNGYWYWGRPSSEDLRQDLRGLFQKIRADWDLSSPGLREEWDKDDRHRHFPYGRSVLDVFRRSA